MLPSLALRCQRSGRTPKEVEYFMQLLGRKSFAGLVAAILATACLGFGSWWFHKSTERETNVTFTRTMKFRNGDTLPAGTYRMEVPDNSKTPTVTFSHYGKVMATVKAKVVTQQKKNSESEVDSNTQGNTQLVTAIHPGGWAEELVFGPTGK